MLLDLESLFSDAQAVTATAASTNVVKTANTTNGLTEIAFGQPIPLLIQVVETFVGATSLKVAVQTATEPTFTSPTTLAESGDIAVASLTAGYKFAIPYVPKGNKGYLRLYYTVTATSTVTAGKITAGIVAAHDNSYQDM